MAESVALEEMREKIAPVVREMLTEKVLLELEALTDLLPKAVARLALLLESDDDDTAFKAATLLLKYTMGNSSIAPPPLEQAGTRLELNIGIPQQGGGERSYSIQGEVVDGEVVEGEPAPELRECMDCGKEKPAEDFMGQSSRCQACHDQMLEQVEARFGKLPVLRSRQ